MIAAIESLITQQLDALASRKHMVLTLRTKVREASRRDETDSAANATALKILSYPGMSCQEAWRYSQPIFRHSPLISV